MTQQISEIQKVMNDLNSTRRLVRYLAGQLPDAYTAEDGEDPNLWCVFEVIADRLESVEDRLEAELAKVSGRRRLAGVDDGGEA